MFDYYPRLILTFDIQTMRASSKYPLTMIAASAALVAPMAMATGLGFWESSASVSALAGAHGASAVDASALAINPSSIAQLERPMITVAASRYQVDTSYEFLDGATGTDYSTADVIPAGFFTMPINSNWDAGLAIYSRTAADISVPDFVFVGETNLKPIIVSVAPSLVYSQDNWSVGLTAEYMQSQYSLSTSTCGFDTSGFFPKWVCNETDFTDETSGWSGAISGTWLINDMFSVAASHKFETQFSDNNIDIHLPSVTSVFGTFHARDNLNFHLSYSYSNWKGKGITYADYDDFIGLLVGSDNSQRVAASVEYSYKDLLLMAGASADQAIDTLGGTDYRWRVGLGYNLTDHWRFDLVGVFEDYAQKNFEQGGFSFVNVQNDGLMVGIGINYQF